MSFKQIAKGAAQQSASTGADKIGVIVNTAARNTAREARGFPKINLRVYDEGGDVDVNDGQHQVAILQDGEKVLTPEEADAYRTQQTTMEPLGAAQSTPSIGRIEPSTSESTETLI